MLSLLKALADPVRLRLVAVLSHGEFTVGELVEIFAMGQSRISRHLKILLEAGVVAVKRQGTWAYYRVASDDPLFRELRPALERRFGTLEGRERDLAGVAKVLEQRRRRSQEFFDRHARQWDGLAEELLALPDYETELLGLVPDCDTVLEIGMGTGRLLAALKGKAHRAIGVDHAPAMVERARERLEAQGSGGGGGIELRLGEMAHLPLRDAEVDCVVLNMVLHHAAVPEAILQEAARVLRPGGRLVLADLARHGEEWLRERLADLWLGFSERELQEAFAAAGFTEVKLMCRSSGEGGFDVLVGSAVRTEESTAA